MVFHPLIEKNFDMPNQKLNFAWANLIKIEQTLTKTRAENIGSLTLKINPVESLQEQAKHYRIKYSNIANTATTLSRHTEH